MIARCSILLVPLVMAASVHASPSVGERSLLRDLICHYETRGERSPDFAVGDDQEIGRCQIKLGTARQVGYRGTRSQLLRAEINRLVAMDIIDRCWQMHRRIRQTIWCYRAGFQAGEIRRTDRYTKWVEIELARLTQPSVRPQLQSKVGG